MMLKSLFLIFASLLAGNALSDLLKLPLPGSVIGLVLLTALLEFKVIKPDDIREGANLLINNMALFFVPAGVGLMLYFDVLKTELLPIGASCVISTFIVIITVSWTFKKMTRSRK